MIMPDRLPALLYFNRVEQYTALTESQKTKALSLINCVGSIRGGMGRIEINSNTEVKFYRKGI